MHTYDCSRENTFSKCNSSFRIFLEMEGFLHCACVPPTLIVGVLHRFARIFNISKNLLDALGTRGYGQSLSSDVAVSPSDPTENFIVIVER